MRRIFGLSVAAGFLAALCFSHLAAAEKPQDIPPEKVKICHIDEVITDYIDEDTGQLGELRKGVVIEVSVHAQPAHMAHGDHLADPGAAIGDACSRFYPAEEPGDE